MKSNTNLALHKIIRFSRHVTTSCAPVMLTRRDLNVEPGLVGTEGINDFYFGNTNNIVALYNLTDNRCIYVNPAATAILGYPSRELISHRVFRHIHPQDLKKLKKTIACLKEGINRTQELRFCDRSGMWRCLEMTGRLLSGPRIADLLILEFKDISKQRLAESFFRYWEKFEEEIAHANNQLHKEIETRRQLEKQLQFVASHDPLTGCYNRAFFEKAVRKLEENKCAPLGMLVCDIDGFRLINDAMGYDYANNLLTLTAQIIKKFLSKRDMVARVGGDEFAVLLPGITEDGLKKIRLQIKRCVKNYNYAHKSFPLSLSLGSSIRTSCSLSVTDLFKEANDNMYKEKLYSNQSTRNAIVNTLMKALGERDHMTEGHGCRLQSLVIAMAQQLKICERRYTDLKLFSQFHDIGKVGVPDSILLKPGPLAPDEAREMMTHCNKGYQIALSAKELTPIADWILKHHEWWNGEGYPLGLKGREIPLECRMLAIADAYDAMINDRPYRKAMMHEKAIKLIIRSSGTQFDPELVPIFISVVDKIKNKRS